MIQKSPASTRFALSSHSHSAVAHLPVLPDARASAARRLRKIIINARGMIKERILCGETATPPLQAKKSGTVILSQRNAMDGFLL